VKMGPLMGAILAAAATIAIALMFHWLSAGSGGMTRTAGPESAKWQRAADNRRGLPDTSQRR
jgi:hypothetical protein